MRLALDWLRKYQMQIAAAVVYFGFFGGCLIFGFAYTGSAIVRSDGPRIAFGIILTVLCAYMVMAGVEGIVQFVIRNRERTHAVDGRGRPLVPTAAAAGKPRALAFGKQLVGGAPLSRRQAWILLVCGVAMGVSALIPPWGTAQIIAGVFAGGLLAAAIRSLRSRS